MTNLILYVVIAVLITILSAKYALEPILKSLPIGREIVPSVNMILCLIIFTLSFGGFHLFFTKSPDNRLVALTKECENRLAAEQAARSAAEQQARIAAEQQARIAAEQAARVAAEQQARLTAEQTARQVAENARLLAEQRLAQQQEALIEAERRARQAERSLLEEKARLVLPTPMPTPTPAPPTDPLANAAQQSQQAAVEAQNVVRSYYQDLHNNNCGSARLKHLSPPAKLCDLIKPVEWFRVNSLAPLSASPSEAIIGVDVTGKNYGQQPRRWVGRFTLKRIGGGWKIATMNMGEVK